MRRLLLLLIGYLAGRKDKPSDTAATSATRAALLRELETLAIGLRVTHTPAEVSGPAELSADPADWRYRWVFETQVSAIDRPLTITQFGILAWDGQRWILPPDQRRYNSGVLDQQTFAEWYGCPDGLVVPGKPAIDPQNWAGSHKWTDFQQKWFFIGMDTDGNRYKGEAIVRLVADSPADRSKSLSADCAD